MLESPTYNDTPDTYAPITDIIEGMIDELEAIEEGAENYEL